jgi:peroxiredoxin
MRLHVCVAAVMAVAFLAAPSLAQTSDEAKDAPSPTEKPAEAKAPPAPLKMQTMTKARIGEKAPDFLLTDTEGNEHRLSDYLKQNKAVILEWFNPDCPFVKKHHKMTRSMAETYAMAAENDMVWLAINSGAPGKQGAGVERNKKAIKDYDIVYPMLLDESGEVGRIYGAKTTPHMFLIDKEGILVYAGAIDNAPNTKKLGDINYVRNAVAACVAGEKIETATSKPYGCSVKYANAGKPKASDAKPAGKESKESEESKESKESD